MLTYHFILQEVERAKLKENMADSVMMNNYNNPSHRFSSPNKTKGDYHHNKFNKYESQETIPDEAYNDISYVIPSPAHQFRKKKQEEHTEEFIGNSTLHGFHYCFDKRYRFRRIFWILVVMGSIGMLLQKLIEAGQKFFDRPFTSTSTVIDVNEMDFPAISICNINDFRMSKMEGTLFHSVVLGKKPRNSITGPEYANASNMANHRLQDMLLECSITFMGKNITPCSYQNFSIFYQSQGEKCFTINSGIPDSRFGKLKDRGRSKSLEMVFNIEHYEYYTDQKEAGMRLIIHDQDETPIRPSGVHVMPGFTTYVEVRKTETLNLEKPYKTACDSRKLDFFANYSENACWLERLTKYIVGKCHCKDRFMPGNAKVCSITELMDCTWPQWEVFKKIPRENLDCPVACRVVDFDTLLSFSKYPSNKKADLMAEEFQLTGITSHNREFIRDNILRIVIYFEKLNYKRVTQAPSYDTMILLGDIGGQLGLFLGTSILTYLEFFDYLAMMIYTKYFEMFKIK